MTFDQATFDQATFDQATFDQATFDRVIADTLREIETQRPDVWDEYRRTKGRTDLVCLEERLGANLEAAFPGVPWDAIYWDAKAIAVRSLRAL